MTSSQCSGPDPGPSWLAGTGADDSQAAAAVVTEDDPEGGAASPDEAAPVFECGRAASDEASMSPTVEGPAAATQDAATLATQDDTNESVSAEETAMMVAIVRPRFVAMSVGLVSIGICIGHVIGLMVI